MFSWPKDPSIKQDDDLIAKKINAFANKWKKDQSYLHDTDALREALEEYEEICQNFYWWTKSSIYFWLMTVTNKDKEIKSAYNKAQDFSTKLSNILQFFELSLGKVDKKNQEKFLADQSVAEYHEFLRNIFVQSRYFLTEKEESLYTTMSKTSYQNRRDMIRDFLASEKMLVLNEKGEKEEKWFFQLHSLLASTDENVRDDAAAHINNVLEKYVDVAEMEINSILEYKKLTDEVRGYERPDQARHLSDWVSSSVVDALVEATVASNNISHDFYEFKAKLLKKDTLWYHERNIPFSPVGSPSSTMKFSFDEAVDIVKKTLSDLDQEFADIFVKMLEQGAIDVYPQEWKEGGAFNAGVGKNIGNFVMVNFNGFARDITTLAHEMGHAIHTELTWNTQNAVNYGYGMFAAEVASTFVEKFALDELISRVPKEEQFALRLEWIQEAIAAVHRQIACYRFEQAIHEEYREKGLVSKEKLWSLFQEKMASYMWPFVEQSAWSENWWLHWSHIRRFFYVYTYSSGLLIAKALQKRVREDKSLVAEIKKHFLSAGQSRSPEQMFAAMGIDITDKTFWEDGLHWLRKDLEETIALAKELGYL